MYYEEPEPEVDPKSETHNNRRDMAWVFLAIVVLMALGLYLLCAK